MLYVLIEEEIKLNYDGTLQYVDDEIISSSNNLKDIEMILVDKIGETIHRGYFDKEYSHTKSTYILYNGGTAYKRFSICKVKE